MSLIALFRGGGDLASGAALRLARAGIQVVIAELPQPMAVRRLVSFAQVIYTGEIEIEGQRARRVEGIDAARMVIHQGEIAVLIDPAATIHASLQPHILVDGRMIKRPPEPEMHMAQFTVGLGPGFTAGINCHAVVETKRGPYLGRVYYQGSAEPDSGQPETVLGHQADRVLRAPCPGILENYVTIGERVELGQPIAAVDGQKITAPFHGLLRGLLMDGLRVVQGDKIGDLDPRDDPRLIHFVSDKALSIGGGVLEAVLSRQELRARFSQL